MSQIRLNVDDLTVTSFATSPVNPGVPTAMPAGTGADEVEVVTKPADTLYSGCSAQTCASGGDICCA